jgi:PAS domain S-box-containing protein
MTTTSSAAISLIGDPTRARRLRRWIIIVGTTAIVANIAASAYDAWRSYRHSMADTRRELSNVARILAEQTEGSLQTVDVLLRDTADWYAHEGKTSTLSGIDAALASRAQGLPQLLSLTISDAHGIEQYRSRLPGPPNVDDITDRSYFVAQRDHPNLGLFISEPIVTRTEKHHAIALSRPLTDRAGRFAGVVAGFIELEEFQRFYRQINLGAHSAILLLRDNGTLILREPAIPGLVGKPLPHLVALAQVPGEPATLMTSPVDGVQRFIAGAPVRGFPLVVEVAREYAVVVGPWRREALRVAGRTLILTLLGAAAIAALVRQVRRAELGERALRESEQHYALAMEGANEGHFDWNLEGGPSFVSPKMNALYGLSPDAPTGPRAEFLARVDVHADDRVRMESAFQDHLEGRSERYELEYRVRHADGEWHWLYVRGRCLRHPDGKPSRFVGSAIDVTAHKQAEAEKERLEAQLRKSQKMEAMGTLAGGIAHDFNNILGAIIGYGELAQKSAEEGSAVRRYIDNVMHAGGRAKALVERILAFSRSGVGERTPVNVEAVVEETLELLAASLPAGVRMERKLSAGDTAVIGDATQLHQVAMNLCTNALQAMVGGGVLEVRLERTDTSEPRALSHGDLAAGPYVTLTVRDTGAGINPEVLDRMFDPFFTTKGVGEGTGLGLSLVHGIVADVGGAIDVASAPGRGTTFTIWLPAAGFAAPPASQVADELPHGNGAVIMVVDDEPALVALAEEMLAELGYEPAGFRSSTAALRAFNANPQRFDLVLTDEMMPDLNGTGLALEIRRLRPDVPIVLMSGYSDTGVAARARAADVSEVLRKPLKTRDIAECLARVLAVSPVSPHAAS